ncbi:ParB/RepB/Spo0J family partition protein [bacterium]|nr:MAG: ParB/RepB/Spo0J family partition protein [bacterium]
MERRGLGRGLGALIPEKEHTGQKEKIVYIAVDDIHPNPYQPRESFNAESLEDLIASIKEKGIIQPVLVRSGTSGYELIAGERRFRAAKSLSMKEIPAIVKEVQDEESLEIALIENIQRQNLNPIEEAHAFKHLMDNFDCTQEKIAQTIGKSRVSVANTLRLLKLPQEIQEMLRKSLLTFAHGKVLLELQDSQRQLALARRVIHNGLSVKELDDLILPHQKTRKPKSEAHKTSSQIKAIEEELQQALGSKVRIVSGHKRGVIHIEFYSQEDLERIYQVIKR